MAKVIFQVVATLAALIVSAQGLGKFKSYVPKKFFSKIPPLPTNPPNLADLCKDVPLVNSIGQGTGPVICLRASDLDLEKQLQQSGGFIRRYVGIKNTDICNFTDPSTFVASLNIPQSSATPTQTPSGAQQRDSTNAEGVSSAHRRTKRTATTSELKCIGKATRNDDTGFFSMCDQCWAITTLEDNRFPRQMNEVICGTTGAKDAQGEPVCWQNVGRCIQKVIKLDFLRWDGDYEETPQSTAAQRILRQKFVPYTQEVRSCCECELKPTFFNRN